jgi:hypothetical protein
VSIRAVDPAANKLVALIKITAKERKIDIEALILLKSLKEVDSTGTDWRFDQPKRIRMF